MTSLPAVSSGSKAARTYVFSGEPVETFVGRIVIGRVALAILLMVTGVGGSAHGAGLRLEQALELASTRHPSVRARLSDRDGAQARLESAKWQRYPQVQVQAAAGTSGTQDRQVVVQVPVWTAGRIQADLDAAELRVLASGQAVTVAQQSISESVLEAFGEWCRLKDRAAAAATSVEQHLRLAALIQRRVDAEVSSLADLTLAQSRLGQARGELRQIEVQIASARSALEQAVGAPVPDIVVITPRSLHHASAESATQTARDASAELQRLQREIEAAQRDAAARRAAQYPQVVARYRHPLGSSSGGSQELFLGLEYQSGAGFSAAAAVREAEARVQTLRLEQETWAQKVEERARTSWVTAQALGVQAEELLRALQSTRDVAASVDRQYVIGRKTWIDVLNAHREVSQVAQTAADARWGAQIAILRLDLLTGLLGSTLKPAAATTR